MPHVHRAAWVLPIVGPPIRNGWVSVADGRVVALGSANGDATPDVAILPGLVNAHIHLELSWMRGKLPPGDSMPAWAERLINLRLTESAGGPSLIVAAIDEVRASGTALVGDVTNGLASYGPLASSALSAAVFLELIGFNPAYATPLMDAATLQIGELTPVDRLRVSIVPHGPYSVSADLMRSIARASRGRPISIHLAESSDELRFLKDGTGPWRSLLERRGVWTPAARVPGCGPVEYLDRFGLLTERLIAVHAVHLTDKELAHLASVGATVVTCPRSNRWTGAGDPPIERFYAAGLRVAIGTDSLASVDDLSMFEEMKMVRRLAPAVAARDILHSATLAGARALGFDGELGAIQPGVRAELIAVRLPAGPLTADDVEEYLVGGVPPADISWLTAAGASTP